MSDCFRTEDWSCFHDDAISPEHSLHLDGCSMCREVAAEFVRLEAQLRHSAAVVREDTAMSTEELREAFTRFRSHRDGKRSLSSCLEALHCFLTGMLGSATGGKVVQAAARKSPVDEAGWSDFIERLASMSSDLCGEAAGSMVAFIGTLPGTEAA